MGRTVSDPSSETKGQSVSKPSRWTTPGFPRMFQTRDWKATLDTYFRPDETCLTIKRPIKTLWLEPQPVFCSSSILNSAKWRSTIEISEEVKKNLYDPYFLRRHLLLSFPEEYKTNGEAARWGLEREKKEGDACQIPPPHFPLFLHQYLNILQTLFLYLQNSKSYKTDRQTDR